MSQDIQELEPQTFVETALKLGGKSEEEARKTGTLDRADEQVEALFAPHYQTAHSPDPPGRLGPRVPRRSCSSRAPTVAPADCSR